MALQYSTTLRNNQLDEIMGTVGDGVGVANPTIQIRTGAPPASCAAADSGTLAVEITLPDSWMAAAASGSVAKSGTAWTGTAGGSGPYTAGHFRIKDSAGTTTHMQGTITATGGGGDMTIDNVTIQSSQSVTVTGFTINAANA